MTPNEMIEAMASGDRIELSVPGGPSFVIYYDTSPAYGDNGAPVPGDVTGEFEVYEGTLEDHPGRAVERIHVAPHGTSGYGNRYAKGHAAERIVGLVTAAETRRRIAAAHEARQQVASQ